MDLPEYFDQCIVIALKRVGYSSTIRGVRYLARYSIQALSADVYSHACLWPQSGMVFLERYKLLYVPVRGAIHRRVFTLLFNYLVVENKTAARKLGWQRTINEL
jgi:hypothetical protein